MCILEFEEPENEPFIILESYPKEGSRNETQKSIYICKTQGKKKIKMGRAQNNDLRVHDISISRNHAEINVNDKKLFIKDQKSKFGTLLLVKSPEFLHKSTDAINVYQIGRSVLFFNSFSQIQGIGSSICACFSKKKNKQNNSLAEKKRKENYEIESKDKSEDVGLILELEIEKLQK